MNSLIPKDKSPIYQHTGRIRSLRIGTDYKDSMVFTVGNVHARVTITKITEDIHDKIYFGIKRYNVFAKRNGSNSERIWKHFDNMPCIVEYFDE